MKGRLIGMTMMLGKIEGKRRRRPQRTRWLYSITNSMDVSLSKHWEIVKDRKAWPAAICGVTKSWTQPSNYTTWMVVLLIWGGTSMLSSIMVEPIYVHTNSTQSSFFSTSSPTIFNSYFCSDSCSTGWEVIYLVAVLSCIFLMICDIMHLFMCLLVIGCLLWKDVFLVSLPILKSDCCYYCWY